MADSNRAGSVAPEFHSEFQAHTNKQAKLSRIPWKSSKFSQLKKKLIPQVSSAHHHKSIQPIKLLSDHHEVQQWDISNPNNHLAGICLLKSIREAPFNHLLLHDQLRMHNPFLCFPITLLQNKGKRFGFRGCFSWAWLKFNTTTNLAGASPVHLLN